MHKNMKKEQQSLVERFISTGGDSSVAPVLRNYVPNVRARPMMSNAMYPSSGTKNVRSSQALQDRFDQIQRMHEIQRIQLEALQKRQLMELREHKKRTASRDAYSSILEGDGTPKSATSSGVGFSFPRSSSISSMSALLNSPIVLDPPPAGVGVGVGVGGNHLLSMTKPRLDSLDAIAFENDLAMPLTASHGTTDIEDAIRHLVDDELGDGILAHRSRRLQLSPIGSTDSEDLNDVVPPPVTPSVETTSNINWGDETDVMNERTVQVHLNIKGNPTSFGIVPIQRFRDSLAYVREYIKHRLPGVLTSLSPRKDSDSDGALDASSPPSALTPTSDGSETMNIRFRFLSKQGSQIQPTQEKDILAMSQALSRVSDGANGQMRCMQHFIFIDTCMADLVSNDGSVGERKRRRDGGEDDEDDEDKTRDIVKRFRSATKELQSRIAMDYFQRRFSSNDSNGDTKDKSARDVDGAGVMTHDENSLLVMATVLDLPDIVRHVLHLGADVNATQRESGDTALHIAARMGRTSIVKIILHESTVPPVGLCGAFDFSIRNRKGETVLDVASSCDRDIQRLFYTFMSEKDVYASSFGLPAHASIADAREILRKAAADRGKRAKAFLFVSNSIPGIAIRPCQEKDFSLEQVTRAVGSREGGGYIRVRIFRRLGRSSTRVPASQGTSLSTDTPREVSRGDAPSALSALETLASLATGMTTTPTTSTIAATADVPKEKMDASSAPNASRVRITGFGESGTRVHVARAASVKREEGDEEE